MHSNAFLLPSGGPDRSPQEALHGELGLACRDRRENLEAWIVESETFRETAGEPGEVGEAGRKREGEDNETSKHFLP